MPKTFRLLLLLATLAAALVAAGCGGDDVPSDSVAKVGDVKITKTQYNHWFLASVKQQAQSTGQKPDQVVAPDPPNFTKCIAAKQTQPLPSGVPKPDAKALKAQCKQEYDGVSQQTLQFLITSQWLTQEAKRRKITASDKEVQTTFQQQKKQSFPKEADYQKFLQTSGQSETDLLFRVKLSVLTNKLQQSIVKNKATVSDAAVQDYYNKNKQRFAQPETRDLQVVLPPRRRRPTPLSRRSSPAPRGRRWRSSTRPTAPRSRRAASCPASPRGSRRRRSTQPSSAPRRTRCSARSRRSSATTSSGSRRSRRPSSSRSTR